MSSEMTFEIPNSMSSLLSSVTPSAIMGFLSMLVDSKMNNVDKIGFDQAVWIVSEIERLLNIQLRDK